MSKNNNVFGFILITSLFFLWGFAHNLDPILIPHLKRSFTLSTVEATLVDSAVFTAYFLMAIPAGIIIKKFGYKTAIITGLLLFALGAFLFIPAADTQQYIFFLVALFIIACGLTTLETAANPYVTVLGPADKADLRINFAQSFNGLASILASLIGGKIILAKGLSDEQLNSMTAAGRKLALAAEASTVKMPYFILACVLVIIAILFALAKLPQINNKQKTVLSKNIFHALRHRHLAWGVAAQFFYVGAQVSIFSLFILYAAKSAELTETVAKYYLAACFLSFTIGRFCGTLLMRFFKSNHLLAVYASINVLLCLVAILAHGMVTVYAVVGICFFMSIMFPTIFALGIKDLEGDTEFGSSLIIMSIVGGAILPRIFGMISDGTNNIQNGYIVPLCCFVFIIIFGIVGHKVAKGPVPDQAVSTII